MERIDQKVCSEIDKMPKPGIVHQKRLFLGRLFGSALVVAWSLMHSITCLP